MQSTIAAEARLARVAVQQHGAFTREQAMRAGFGASQLQRRVAAGAWARVLPRVYRNGAAPETPALLWSAALLWAGPECALSHTTAATIWRFADGFGDRAELTVPRARAPRHRGVVVHRVATVQSADVALRAGLRVTAPARTLIDLASVASDDDLELAVARAGATGLVTRRALEARLAAIGARGRPGAARLRTLLRTFGSAHPEPSARMAG
jgi:hypothetical protein